MMVGQSIAGICGNLTSALTAEVKKIGFRQNY